MPGAGKSTIAAGLKSKGFDASPTSLNPTGFRTSARIDKILEIFSS